MAQLKDTIIQGDARVTGTIYGNVPTPSVGTDTTQIANTEFVNDSIRSEVLLPDFNGMTPVRVIEYGMNSTNWYQFATRPNVADASDLTDTIAYRITITGAGIKAVGDFVTRWMGSRAPMYPFTWGWVDTFSTSAVSTGVRYIRTCYPKALNNGYPYILSFQAYNATSRHIKIEVFKDSPNVTWMTSLTNSTYNSTYHNTNDITWYSSVGFIGNVFAGLAVSSASTASYITSRLTKTIGANPIVAGEAIGAASTLFYVSKTDHKGYKTATTTNPIDPAYGIISFGNTVAINATISYAYSYTKAGSFNLANTGVTAPTGLALGVPVYMRCHMNSGNIYCDNVLSTTMDAGYTWYLVGYGTSASAISVNTEDSHFMTLDADGKLTHVDGVEIAGGGGTISATATLTVVNWSNDTQTVTVTGVTSSNDVMVSPAPASTDDYVSAGIICTAQGTNSLTFTCVTVPTNAITINVLIFK